MHIIIVGGGKVGYYLTKTLAPHKHKVTLIEEDPVLCRKISGEMAALGIRLVNGDGTNVQCLEDAAIRRADVLIAVTGQDQNNLVACQLAKNHFGVERTIARVNNPKNIHVFERLSVDSVVSSTVYIANIIEHEVDWSGIHHMITQKSGNVRMKSIVIGGHSPAVNRCIAELSLPKGTVVACVVRGSEAFVPNGQTSLVAGDLLVVLTHDENQRLLERWFDAGQVISA